ncbi:hypothetical protein [Paenibacillus hexagrammi]|uniref:Uncharacterized protein n=1 Tax=Paenibacillus hexagrammi TaxID=2908839 RepID=A0ABY3SMW8_9BACL|nr:hypothetical protein [Paenibacillus sp. YPD9-1]UJF34828.1 hypothetical protein L0M14_06635 [Paenibacillus sp. YPD9-1]
MLHAMASPYAFVELRLTDLAAYRGLIPPEAAVLLQEGIPSHACDRSDLCR